VKLSLSFISIIVLMILLLASVFVGYEAANSWDNVVLANWALFFFTIFWACILVLSIKVCPDDTVSREIEDHNYTPNNVNSK